MLNRNMNERHTVLFYFRNFMLTIVDNALFFLFETRYEHLTITVSYHRSTLSLPQQYKLLSTRYKAQVTCSNRRYISLYLVESTLDSVDIELFIRNASTSKRMM